MTSSFLTLDDMRSELRKCRKCAEAGYRIESTPVFSGPANARVMLIGQAPGIHDGEMLRPFDGDAGMRLFKWLKRAGWREDEFRATCVMTSVTKCFPGKATSGGGDRLPSAAERELCRPWLDAELAFISPKVIIPIGMAAIRLFFPPTAKLDEVVGELVTDDKGRKIVPLPHPSGVSRWHQVPANLGKIEKAIFILRMLKTELDL